MLTILDSKKELLKISLSLYVYRQFMFGIVLSAL